MAARTNIFQFLNIASKNLSKIANLEQLKETMFKGSDIIAQNRLQQTALHLASCFGHSSVLQALVESKADLTALDAQGKSALALAKNQKCQDELKRMGADGWTELMVAAETDDQAKVDELLSRGYSVNCGSIYNLTPLHVAAQHSNADVVLRLIAAQADVNAADVSGNSPVDVADSRILSKDHQHPLLLQRSSEYTSCDSCSCTMSQDELYFGCKACEYAKCRGCKERERTGCAKFLQSLGADGWTPLMMAVSDGNSELLAKYFRFREAVQSIQNQTPFPSWVEGEVLRKLTTQEMSWTWFSPRNLRVDDHGLKIRKTQSEPDYSACLTSEIFVGGMKHSWTILVENVDSMWIGIARGENDTIQLDTHPSECQAEFLIAFGSGGDCVNIGGVVSFDDLQGFEYFSGQTVEFELDTQNHTLKVMLDGVLKVTVRNLDDKDVRGYVCMDYKERAAIISRSSHPANLTWDSLGFTDHDRKLAFDNSMWPADLDILLSRLPYAGACKILLNRLFVWRQDSPTNIFAYRIRNKLQKIRS